ncbi:hypothetical protein [Hahella sp. HN01]|uniref:hypothetical protein n=1 Tax=Hahella sp. HN01 TaxID=2847262 RepID=UPI001C1E9BB0|nr:hypothetical protein [Hahella sp. HN01]MBU6951603.1 hypothetical protein [Hahella sp. HN01]
MANFSFSRKAILAALSCISIVVAYVLIGSGAPEQPSPSETRDDSQHSQNAGITVSSEGPMQPKNIAPDAPETSNEQIGLLDIERSDDTTSAAISSSEDPEHYQQNQGSIAPTLKERRFYPHSPDVSGGMSATSVQKNNS